MEADDMWKREEEQPGDEGNFRNGKRDTMSRG
jgi:hypothetical protein